MGGTADWASRLSVGGFGPPVMWWEEFMKGCVCVCVSVGWALCCVSWPSDRPPAALNTGVFAFN